MSRRRGKRDGNHSVIVDALEAHGWWVLDLAAKGGGCPELFAYRTGVGGFGEVKNRNGRDRLGEAQARWAETCPCPVHVVRDVEDVKNMTAGTWQHAGGVASRIVEQVQQKRGQNE